MRFKRSIIAFAAAALATCAFASSAMANGGVLKDTNGEEITNGTQLHAVGWAKFEDEGGNGLECHVTAIIEAENGETGHVTNFTPETESCVGTGVFNECILVGHENTNLPWHVTTTASDFDVTGNIVIHNQLESCEPQLFIGSAREATLTFEEITLTPLEEGERKVTNTENHLGNPAGSGVPIFGVKLHGKGVADVEFSSGFEQSPEITATGELELTEPERGTWQIE